MPLMFYPYSDDVQKGTLNEKIETLMSAAQRFKAAALDTTSPLKIDEKDGGATPRHLTIAYNWEEIARILREIRELPEGNKTQKLAKADYLVKLAEIYEVLRAAKMSKLEAVRLALMSESNQLKGDVAQTGGV